MMRALFRKTGPWLASACAAATLIAAAPAVAQIAVPAPKTFSQTDGNGIDVLDGGFSGTIGTISVGPADGGLSNTLSFSTSATGAIELRHSIAGGMSRQYTPGETPVVIGITLNGVANHFSRQSNGSFVLRSGEGGGLETVGGLRIFTAPDGSRASYSSALSGPDSAGADLGAQTLLEKPNGEVWTYHYNGSTDETRVLQSVTSNRGYQIHFEYGAGTREATRVTAFNNAVDPCAPLATSCSYSQTWPSYTIAYNTTTGAFTLTDALNRTTTVSGSGITRPDGRSLTLGWGGTSWNGANVVVSASDGAGTWTYAYGEPPMDQLDPTYYAGPFNTTNSVTDPNSQSTSFNVNWSEESQLSFFRLKRVITSSTNPVGQTSSYQYSGWGRQIATTNPEGDSQTTAYLRNGTPWYAQFDPKPGSGLTGTTILATYGDCSTPILCRRPTAITDQRGNVTDFTYDAAGNLLTVTAPAPTPGAVRPQTRNAYAQQYAWYKQAGSSSITQAATPIWVLTETSACSVSASCNGLAEEVQSTTTYQAGSGSVASNLLPVSSTSGSGDGALAATVSTTWTNAGDPAYVDGPLAGSADTTRMLYDVMRRQVGVIGPDPDGGGARLFPATRTTLNAADNPTSVERGTTTGQGDVNWAAFSALQTDTASYNAQGRKAQDTTNVGSVNPSVIQYAYDAEGRPTCTAQRMNPAVFGSLPGSACTLGTAGSFGPDRITHTTYDTADRPTEVRIGYATPDARLERVQAYTANSQVDWVEDGLGNRSDYTYDGFDRLSRLAFPSTTVGAHAANASDYEQYGYDAANNPTTKRTRSGDTFTTTFDALNRITLIDAPSGTKDTSFAYDLLSRRLTATTVGGQTVTSVWDALGRNTSETGALGAMAYQYDLAGRRTRMTWPSGGYANYAWNLDNGMQSITWGAGASAITAYAYDDLGRRTGITRGNGVTTSYGYNTASQLTSLSHDLWGTVNDVAYSFSYTPAPQIAGRTVSNSVYDYTPTSGTTAYANNGLNQSMSAGGASVTWDTRGNLTSDSTRSYTYDAANRLLTGGGSSLTYDPLDRLYSMTGTGAGRFQYDGSQLAGVYDGSGALLGHYIAGPSPDEWALWDEGGANIYPLQDAQGSVIALTNGAGAAISTLAYDEYGQPRSGNTGRMQYTGQAWMPDMGLYYYKARGYHAGLGRFVQTDPVGYEQGLNLYAYVGGDPVNATDPKGTEAGCMQGPSQCGSRQISAADQRAQRGIVRFLANVAEHGLNLISRGVSRLATRPLREASGIDRPVSTLRPGPHADRSIPARSSDRNFTASERAANNENMAQGGCHTCGTRDPGTRSGNAVPDHQPPSAVNPPGGRQDLYPQCLNCSTRQMREVRQEQLRMRREGE